VQYEFPYIDNVSKELLDGNHIFIDTGKRSLLTMMDDDGNLSKLSDEFLLFYK
jgi:hypothetical protein